MRMIAKVARVAFTFVTMNYAAIAGLVALARGGDIWVAESAEARKGR